MLQETLIINNNEEIKYVNEIEKYIQENEVNLSFDYNYDSDLIKGIYEGGFKIWECTVDLLEYLSEQKQIFNGKIIMDVGCGHGLLGIYALQQNAQKVIFQDFNKEVLEIVTQSNLKANNQDINNCKFTYGDWNQIKENMGENFEQVDLMLMSEVIYQPENYEKIINVMVQSLKQGGSCLMANKLFYFGVGGSIQEFLEIVIKKFSNELKVESAKFLDNKYGTKREILKFTKL